MKPINFIPQNFLSLDEVKEKSEISLKIFHAKKKRKKFIQKIFLKNGILMKLSL